MAKKGHTKKQRYDLNQISCYIAANSNYIPLYGESYHGNVHDARTFENIIGNIPENATLIFVRGYNSKDNIDLKYHRRYIGALKLSDHRDIMELLVEKDSHIELVRNVYRRYHRIIPYHFSSLEGKRKKEFMKRVEKVMVRAKKLPYSGDPYSMERARICLESEKLNETILLPSLKINLGRMDYRMSMMFVNSVFFPIMDMNSEGIIELYRKRDRVEHFSEQSTPRVSPFLCTTGRFKK